MTNEAPAGPTEPTPPPAAPAKKRGASRIVTPILALVAALAIGLFGGVIIGHSTASASTTRAGFQGRAGGFGQEGGTGGTGGTGGNAGGGATGNGGAAQGGFGGFTSGTIVSVSGDTITLKETNGTTVKVTTTGSTTVTKTTKSSVSKLTAGENLTVIGKADGSGNVAATTITEGQSGFRGARPGGATGGTGTNN
jgi:hypothetical protein